MTSTPRLPHRWLDPLGWLLLLAAVLCSALLNLALTLPLLLLGGALLCWGAGGLRRRLRLLADALAMGGVTLGLLGTGFIAVNLQRAGWFQGFARPRAQAPAPAPASRAPTLSAPVAPAPLVVDEPGRHVADYGTDRAAGAWVSGADQPLGYAYQPNLGPLRSRLVGEQTGRPIYDVEYTIDSRGNRVSTHQPTGPAPLALFVGCSFTFGEGLNNADTLASAFARQTGWRTVNAGMHGYGSHQAYTLLASPALLTQRVGNRLDLVIYRMIGDHAARASGRYAWDRHGPCYQRRADGSLEAQGPFSRCRRRWGWLSATNNVLETLSQSREPFTRDLAASLDRAINEPRDHARQLALVLGMKRQAEARGARFLVLNETLSPAKVPDGSGRYSCERPTGPGSAQAVGDRLRRLGVAVLDTGAVLDLARCRRGAWATPGDGHPSAAANQVLAQALARRLGR